MPSASYHRGTRRRHAAWGLLAWLSLWMAGTAQAASAPTVLVSIKPLHALAAMVMEGAGKPDLLIPAAASPHTYALRPSDARRLQQARILFWVGAGLESFLPRAIAGLSDHRVVALLEAPEMALLPRRSGGAWEGHEDHHGDHGAEQAGQAGQAEPTPRDAHLWLDPANARAMLGVMARVLGETDPERAALYTANARKAEAALTRLEQELHQELAGVKQRPFVVFHDAFQYFEHRFGLSAQGSITLHPEHPPGARRIQELRARIRDQGVVCVFTEPQFRAALAETVVEGSQARTGTLDPYGLAHPPGAEAYAATLRGLTRDLRSCLEKP